MDTALRCDWDVDGEEGEVADFPVGVAVVVGGDVGYFDAPYGGVAGICIRPGEGDEGGRGCDEREASDSLGRLVVVGHVLE